ncbi:MAG: hypothetical protein ACK56F_11795, partial [bacterium]
MVLGDRSWLLLILWDGRGLVLCTSIGRTMDSILTLVLMLLKLTRVIEILRAVSVLAFVLFYGVLLHLRLIYMINLINAPQGFW